MLRFYFFFFNDTATTEIYTLSLHDALPISISYRVWGAGSRSTVILLLTSGNLALGDPAEGRAVPWWQRSEEHTSELQSRQYLVCRLLLEKKKLARRTSQARTRHD